MIETGSVVENIVVFERRQDISSAEFEQVDAALVDGEPERFGPVGCEGLLKITII